MNNYRYLAFLADHQGSLQPTCCPRNKKRAHPTRVVGYSLAVQDFRNLITLAGHDGKDFSEHSNKRGGASHAANSGIPEEEIRDIGNWKSLKTARLYIDHNTPLRQKRNSKLQNLI